jgi:tetratricopeptide (TPR) repeat protein
MRWALVVAPSDPLSGDAAERRSALAGLRGQLARFGFHVVIVGGSEDPFVDLEHAIVAVCPGDTVLVHVSGLLVGRDSLSFGGGRSVPLVILSEWLAIREPGHVSLVVEVTHEEDPLDALLATECLAALVDSLGAKERGYPVLAAVRPLSLGLDRFAFTQIALPPVSGHAGPPPTEALVAAMYDRASATPESHAVAQSFTFARGGFEPLAPPEAVGVADEPAAGPSIHSLIAEAEEVGDWPRAVALRGERLGELASPRQKVRELVAIARILQVALGDAEGALGALEVARALEPTRASVLEALRRGYEKLGRWTNAFEVTGVLAQLEASPAVRANLRFAQARIAIDPIGDEDRAVALLEAALEDEPTHAEALATLTKLRPPKEPDVETREKDAERLLAEGAADDALAVLDAIAEREPTRASIYALAFTAHRRVGRTDASFLAALALEELEATDVDHQILIDQFRTGGPVRPRASLDPDAWDSLRAPGSDPVLAALFAAIERAAIAVRVDELRSRRQLAVLDPDERLSETSTASIARSFRWAARFLGIGCPHLVVKENVPGGIEAVLASEPTTALGLSVTSGHTVKDLAFLAGRHLTYYRPEHQVLLYYPTREDLTRVLFAAVQLAMPDAVSAAAGGAPARKLSARIKRHLRKDERAALRDAVGSLDARGGRAAIGAWVQSVELTAARAGLLLCGDLAAAMALARLESRDVAKLSLEAKRGDLVAFCASRSHAELRARFAMTAPESLPAPPLSSSAQAAQ